MAILGLVYHWLFTVMFLQVPSMERLSDEQAQVGQIPSLSLTEHCVVGDTDIFWAKKKPSDLSVCTCIRPGNPGAQ